ncbi:MAG: energy transducer TonB [Helicobacter sp.]|nr:energy transducer TonB [Helicobacter sp.]
MRKYGAISLALSLCIHLVIIGLLYYWLQPKPMPQQPQRISLGNLKLETLPNTQIAPKNVPQAPQPAQQTPLSPQQPTTSTQQISQQKSTNTKKPQATSNTNTATSTPPSFYELLQENFQSPWQEFYGEEAYSLSKEDKAYLDENYHKIYTITQRNLRYPPEAGRLGLQGTNRVEFYLQPNGDITDLRITSSSGYAMFDKNSLRTIEISYKDYPRPKKPLKIIFYIHYKIGY